MSHLIELIKAFVPHIPTQQERDEAYLSESVDMADVERRIWEIDHRGEQTQPTYLGGALH
jgi:hypothetical protein